MSKIPPDTLAILQQIPGFAETEFGKVPGKVKKGLDATKPVVQTWATAIGTALSNVASAVGGAAADAIGLIENVFSAGTPKTKHKKKGNATGGPIFGYGGGDIVSTMLEPGEARFDQGRGSGSRRSSSDFSLCAGLLAAACRALAVDIRPVEHFLRRVGSLVRLRRFLGCICLVTMK